jgi:small basic protein
MGKYFSVHILLIDAIIWLGLSVVVRLSLGIIFWFGLRIVACLGSFSIRISHGDTHC